MGSGRRRIVTHALVVGAFALTLATLLAGYARIAAVDADQFADRAAAALRDEAVSELIAARITDDIVLDAQADLIAARPLIQAIAAEIVGGGAFGDLFRAGVRDVHRALFDRRQDTLTLTVADVGTVAAAGVALVRPALADAVRASGAVALVTRDVGAVAATAAEVADDVRLLALVTLLALVAVVAAALAAAPDRRQVVVALGIAVAAAGVVTIAGLDVLRALAVERLDTPDAAAAAGAVWDAFLSDLRSAAWVLGGSGAVVAAAAASLIRPVELGEPLRRLGRLIATEPDRPPLRALRGAAFVVAGVVVLVAPERALRTLASAGGLYLVYAGVAVLLRLSYRVPQTAVGARRRGAPASILALVLILLAGGGLVATGGASAPAAGARGCNGHEELCERTLAEVALPATHNSMSVPLAGWFSAEQDAPIPAQLDDGIRGLLIDTHYADRLASGRVRTELGARLTAGTDGVNPEAVQAALRLRERAGFAGDGERGIYLCHSFCELGASPLDKVLQQLRDFLVANPDEVVVVVNQDEVTPEDFVGAVRAAGLERFAYAGPLGGPGAPTLREMIDGDERLVLLAEHDAGGAAPWYRPVYEEAVQETPFHFATVGELTDPAARERSCAPNRGPAGAPLFLLNHWVTTDPLPLPSQAATVNASAPLLARARLCGSLRNRIPNLVAVNFYRRGDLFGVVDELNGVR